MLSNIECGYCIANLEWILRLAKLLQVREKDLYTYMLTDRIQEHVHDEKVTKDSIKTAAMKIGMKEK